VLPRVCVAASAESPEHQRSAGGCDGDGGIGGEGGEEKEEEESVRRCAVPAGVGRRVQGRQDDLARRFLPDHQDQPLQGDPLTQDHLRARLMLIPYLSRFISIDLLRYLQCRTVGMGRRGGFGTRQVSISPSLPPASYLI
jgi:hypothetical protein